MSQVKQTMDSSERAARDLLNKKVREGIIDRRNANEIIKTGLPLVRTMLAEWRRDDYSPAWITSKLRSIHVAAIEKHEAVSNPIVHRMTLARVVAAEMYLAVWDGMQADLGQAPADSECEAAVPSSRDGYIYNESSMGYDKFDRVKIGSRVRVSDLWSVPGIGTVVEKAYHPETRASWIDVNIDGFGVTSYHPCYVHPVGA